MPRCHEVSSLRVVCLTNIAQNFESYWCSGNNSVLLTSQRLLYVIGPFYYLHDDAIQELMEIMVKKKLLRRHHLYLLLHNNIYKLNLSVCGHVANHPSVLEFVALNCQKLTHLNISGFQGINANVLCKVLKQMKKLVCLNLERTKTNKKVLQTIVENCANLVDLNIESCSLKDCDHLILCDRTGSIKDFPKLIKLEKECVDETTETVAALLKHQPGLKSLGDCGRIEYALEKLYGQDWQLGQEVPTEWKTNLTLLPIVVSWFSQHEDDCSAQWRFELAVECCPRATEAHIIFIKDESYIRSLSKLKYLRTIELSMDSRVDIFPNGLCPVLTSIGQNITALDLCSLRSEYEVLQIGKLCPELKSFESWLDAVSLQEYQPIAIPTTRSQYFCHLLNLSMKINYDDDADVVYGYSEDLLSLILESATNIKNINMRNLFTLTDNIILHADQKHGFKMLEKFECEECHTVTVVTGDIIMATENPLKVLKFAKCKNVSLQDCEGFEKEKKRRNMTVDIEWE